MITTWMQYRITAFHLYKFREALDAWKEEDVPENVDPILHKAGRDALQSKLNDFERELLEFEIKHPEQK